jgi:hypothetical protein
VIRPYRHVEPSSTQKGTAGHGGFTDGTERTCQESAGTPRRHQGANTGQSFASAECGFAFLFGFKPGFGLSLLLFEESFLFLLKLLSLFASTKKAACLFYEKGGNQGMGAIANNSFPQFLQADVANSATPFDDGFDYSFFNGVKDVFFEFLPRVPSCQTNTASLLPLLRWIAYP